MRYARDAADAAPCHAAERYRHYAMSADYFYAAGCRHFRAAARAADDMLPCRFAMSRCALCCRHMPPCFACFR